MFLILETGSLRNCTKTKKKDEKEIKVRDESGCAMIFNQQKTSVSSKLKKYKNVPPERVTEVVSRDR